MKTRNQIRAEAGFTLYEVLITLVIVGIVLSFGVANLGDLSRNGKMTSTANDMLAAFHLARSEAARAKTNITICASASGAACGGTWDQGYIIFSDTGADLTVDGTDVVLRRQGPIEDGVSMSVENAATYFGYAATGLGRGNVGGLAAVTRIAMCDERGNEPGAGGNATARVMVVTPLGRGTILRDLDQVQNAIDDMGVSCP